MPTKRNTQYGKEDFYVYGAKAASLAAGDEVTVNIQLEADSDFEWQKTTFFATDDLSGVKTNFSNVLPLITVQIQDSGSGRNLFNQPILVRNIAGDGELPFVLPIARLFRANSNISISFKNISSGTIYLNPEISLIGRKLWAR